VTADISRLAFSPLTQEEAEAIAEWHYEPPYDFYDAREDANDLAELLDPLRRGDRYFSAREVGGELIGFFQFERAGDVVDVGLGLRPDLTGQGFGLRFLEHGLAFARDHLAPRRFTLSVAEFNERAITVYERAGFVQTRSYMHETNDGIFPFIEMDRPA
jgi:ribosomal-protein-alanine N-acetyltransferase